MPARKRGISFAEYFKPADIAHVNWLSKNMSTLLAGSDNVRPVRQEVSEFLRKQDGFDGGVIRMPSGIGYSAFASEAPLNGVSGLPERMTSWLRALDADSQIGRTDRSKTAEREEGLIRRVGLQSGFDEAVPSLPATRSLSPASDNAERWLTSDHDPSPNRGLPAAESVGGEPEARYQEVVQQTPSGDVIIFRDLGPDTIEDGRQTKYPARKVVIHTDKGRPVIAKVNLSRHKNLDANCHGYTFANGRVVIDPDQVGRLLDDEYTGTPAERVQPGDIVVYYDDEGRAVHSARVVAVRDGEIIVEGKIGQRPGLKVSRYQDQWPPYDDPEAVFTPRFFKKKRRR